MKKIIIWLSVIIMGIILIYTYSSKKKVNDINNNTKIENTNFGVSLPEEARKNNGYSYKETASSDISYIIENFSKTWDTQASEKGKVRMLIPAEGAQEILRTLSLYQACVALSSLNRNLCLALPKGERDALDVSPRFRCQFVYDSFAVIGLSNNILKNENICPDFMETHGIKGHVSEKEFCPLLSNLNNLCDNAKGKAPKTCRMAFPRNIKDCQGEIECENFLIAQSAIKKSNPEECLPLYKPLCQSFINKNANDCEVLKYKLMDTYNKYTQKGQEILNAEQKKLEEEKKKQEEEKLKKENEKIKEEVKKQQEKLDAQIRKMKKAAQNEEGE